MNQQLSLLLTVLPSIVIGGYFVRRAISRRPQRFRLSDYFLAGGQIGPTQTRANALGSNIALANGLWYFVVLGYLDGIIGITAQITWCLSIFLVGFLVPTILQSARRGETLHGFLGHAYDSQVLRVGCAIVTGTGYLLNFGFETYVSGTILASILGGDERLRWVFVLALVLSSGTYISIAGFLGNISHDRTQNWIGIVSMVLIAGFATVTIFMARHAGTGGDLPSLTLVSFSWTKYLGILAYTSIFNMVDVSNWQSVAANKYLSAGDTAPKLKRAWTQTAVLALIFPGVVGILIGYLLRSTAGIPETGLIAEVFRLIIPDVNEYVRLSVIGILLMGLFVLALGYAENLLSAAQFTFMADVFGRRRYDTLVTNPDPTSAGLDREDTFVHTCQRTTFAIAIASIVLFVLAMWALGRGNIQDGEATVFSFMFIIFGSAISMFPALLVATLNDRRGLRSDDKLSRIAAIASVTCGYVVALSPLMFPEFAELSPVFTIVTATAVLSAIRGLAWAKGKNRE